MLVAAYRLLAEFVAERAERGRPVEVHGWEYPWIRRFWSPERGRTLNLKLPACAVLCPRQETSGGHSGSIGNAISVLFLPDLGTVPVSRYREALQRLALSEEVHRDIFGNPESELFIATIDPRSRGNTGRGLAAPSGQVGRTRQQPAPLLRGVNWGRVRS